MDVRNLLTAKTKARFDALEPAHRETFGMVLAEIGAAIARDVMPPLPREGIQLGAGTPRRRQPWRSRLTPNQTILAVRMLVKCAPIVTVAAEARCDASGVAAVASEYASQIESMKDQTGAALDRSMASLHRQMLHRWQAAGNSIDSQPESPAVAVVE